MLFATSVNIIDSYLFFKDLASMSPCINLSNANTDISNIGNIVNANTDINRVYIVSEIAMSDWIIAT